MIQRKKSLLMAQPHQVTVSGLYVTFETDIVAPLEITGTGNITVCGKNMLDPSTYTSQNPFTTRGITASESNGIVTFSGNAKDASSSIQMTFAWMAPFTENYYLSAEVDHASSYVDVYMWDITTSARCKQWDGSTNSLSATKARPLVEVQYLAGHNPRVTCRVFAMDREYNNDTFKPMILPKTCTDPTFEPYRGSTLPISSPRKSLKGMNNVWSDSGNPVTVTYWTY